MWCLTGQHRGGVAAAESGSLPHVTPYAFHPSQDWNLLYYLSPGLESHVSQKPLTALCDTAVTGWGRNIAGIQHPRWPSVFNRKRLLSQGDPSKTGSHIGDRWALSEGEGVEGEGFARCKERMREPGDQGGLHVGLLVKSLDSKRCSCATRRLHQGHKIHVLSPGT